MRRQVSASAVRDPLQTAVHDALSEMSELASVLYGWNWLDTTGGSMSIRLPAVALLFAMTPTHSGFRRWRLSDDGLVVVDQALERSSLSTASYPVHPSAVVHLEIYEQFPEACAVLHCHAPYSLVYACAGTSISPYTLQSQILGEVPCIDSNADELREGHPTAFVDESEKQMTSGMAGYGYALDHFRGLITDIERSLGSRRHELKRHGLAFIVYRHGIFVIARTLNEAFDNLIRVERNAQVQLLARLLEG